MKILITGSTGLVGSELIPLLLKDGNTVTRLTRSKSGFEEDVAYWDPQAGEIDSGRLEGHGAVVHLAGENIAGRWTEEKKRKIEESRVKGTKLLSDALSSLDSKPSVIVAASAIGYYGDRGDEVLTEESGAGEGFLAEVSVKWENALKPAIDAGIRVVNTRLGVVLSPEGGALEKMLLPFKLGLGGKIGSGEQYWSWIALDDVAGAISHCITTENLTGPVNLAAPDPVTNKKFTDTLGEVLGRPTLIPLPSFLAKGLLGEMADELLLSSARVKPVKLLESGYKFKYPALRAALEHLLS
ncbi:MAG: TIGR01777 family oxidoreductase [Deltaproteobacteria bacterium]